MQTNKTHLPSLLILLVLAFSGLTLLMLSFVMTASSLLGFIRGEANPASDMISAFVFFFETLLVFLCAWFVAQKTLAREQASIAVRFPFSEWQLPVFLIFIFAALIAGAVIAYQQINWLSALTLPLFTVLVIALPVWLLLGIGSKGIDLGPRWQTFGIFGLGLTLSPVIMIVLEVILLLVFLIVAGIFLATQPELLKQVMDLRVLLKHETNQDVIIQALAPYLVTPSVMTSALLFIAVFVPLIEEFFKPFAVLFFAKHIETPAQGFVLGLLSGAGFALLESLNASTDASTTWGVIVGVRAGTTLLHITASGLVGWGMILALRERKILRGIAAYLSAVMIHGLWNASALGAGLSTIGYLVGKPEWVFAIVPAALGGMFTLGVGMFLVLIASNIALRRAAAPQPQLSSE